MIYGNFNALDEDEEDGVLVIDEGYEEHDDQMKEIGSRLMNSNVQSNSSNRNSLSELNNSNSSLKTRSTRRRMPPKRIGEDIMPNIKLEQNYDDENSSMPDLNASNISTNSFRSTNKRFGPKRTSRPILEPMMPIIGERNDDENPNVKPRHSYCTLIIMSLLSAPNYTMTLNEMYCYLSNRFAYYRYSKGNWQNGIRHNLSLSKLFKKIPKPDGQNGKGGLWTFAKHVNPDVQFKSIQPVRPKIISASTKRSFLSNTIDDQNETNTSQNHQEEDSMYPLRTLVLEQLKNAAYGLYSNNNVSSQNSNVQFNGKNSNLLPNNSVFGQNEQSTSGMSQSSQKSNDEPQISVPGSTSRSLEQLALAQSNWYVAQLATQRGFALVPHIYERCLKQVNAYYKKPSTDLNNDLNDKNTEDDNNMS